MSDLDYLLDWTAGAVSHLAGPEQAVWLTRLDGRRPEIVEALADCFQRQAFEQGLRLATTLGRFWWMCGHAAEGEKWLGAFLQHTSGTTVLRADAFLALGGVLYARARYVFARQFLEQAGYLYQALAEETGQAQTLNQLGMVARESGDLEGARKLHEEALEICTRLGDAASAVSCQSNLGVVALFAGDADEAHSLHQAALEARRRLGDVRGVASSLGSLANIARWRGDLEEAQAGHEQVLAMRQDLGDRWGIAGSLVNLASLAILRGEHDRAIDLLGQSQKAFTEVQDRLGLCEVLDARAELTAAQGHPAEAVRLFAAAHQARKEIGAPLPPIHQRVVERILAELGAHLSQEVFTVAWQTGLSPRYSPFPCN